MSSYREQILSLLSLPSEGSLLVAFSGGSDSLALLSLLPRERTRALYVNHHIRTDEELEKEIALNRRNCERLWIPLKIVELERDAVERLSESEGIGTEGAARALRYEALLSEDADWILTAHHQDDEVETFLMRVLDGSPFWKYEGVRKVDGRIWRPMLNVPKILIENYLEEAGLEYSYDSTNSDTTYRRNSIRQRLLPLITETERNHISRIAENLAFIRSRERELSFSSVNGRYLHFSRSEYLSSGLAEREDLLFRINREIPEHARLKRDELRAIDECISSGRKRYSGTFELRLKGDEVRVYPLLPFIMYSLDGTSFSTPYFSCMIDEGDVDSRTLIMDLGLLEGPAIIRTSLPQDRIELKDGCKSVRDLEKDQGIPYSLVLEDRRGIEAVFMRLFGGRDRLASNHLGKGGNSISII